MSESIFSPQQLTALDALSNGATITEAAAQAGVHRNTIGNWRRETIAFQMALANAHYDKALFFREKAEAMAGLAFDAIQSILTDPQASPSVRLKAALVIVNLVTTQIDPQEKVKITVADHFDAPNKMHNSAQLRILRTLRQEIRLYP